MAFRQIMAGLRLLLASIPDYFQQQFSLEGSHTPHLTQDEQGQLAFSPQRQALHDQIVNHYLTTQQDPVTKQHVKVQRKPLDDPTYTVLGGGPASGKSSLIDNGVLDEQTTGENPVRIDSDMIKEQLPEYNDMVAKGDLGAASHVHDESSYLATKLADQAFANRYNIVMDGTGDGPVGYMSGLLDNARGHGYQVNGAYATVPTDMAIQRAESRARTTGRQVDPNYSAIVHSQVSKVLPQIADRFDNLKLYDTTAEPRPIYSYNILDGEQVHDPNAYQQFLNKANEV